MEFFLLFVDIRKNLMYTTCTELVIQEHLLSHFGLIAARMSASDKELPVSNNFNLGANF
jgi:hypothetical protein